MRDQHSGCVGEYLVEHDLFDFLLFSLPDNDTHSHKNGPFAQVDSLAAADRQLARLMDAAGGADAFLEDHAVIVCSDHSQSRVEQEIDLFTALDDFGVLPAARARGEDSEVAVCPNSRAAMVYVLDRDRRRKLLPRIEKTVLELDGVDLVLRMTDHPDGEAAIRGRARRRGARAALHAGRRPRGPARRALERGGRPRPARARRPRGPRSRSATYPDALGRAWSALRTRTAGEVILLSAAPGYEFLDWGGAHHVGGGSHGSLHANDSHGSLIWCGTGPDSADAREQWSLRDIVPMVYDHFGL